jgi:ribosome-associated heat shock protein Hsp15
MAWQWRPQLRIDKFLYFVRLAKSRSKAQALVQSGSPRIDGKAVTSFHENLRAGQTLTLALNGQIRAIRIEAIPHRRGPAAEAQGCYSDMIVPQPIDVSGS